MRLWVVSAERVRSRWHVTNRTVEQRLVYNLPRLGDRRAKYISFPAYSTVQSVHLSECHVDESPTDGST